MSNPTRPVWALPAMGAASATAISLLGGINVDDPNVVPSVKAKKLLRTLVLGAAAGLGAEAMLRGGGIAYRGLMSKSSSAEQIKRFRNKTLYSLIKQGADVDSPGISTVPESPMVPTTTPEIPSIPGNPVTNVAETEKPITPSPTETNTTSPDTKTPPKQEDTLPWHRQTPLGFPNGYLGYGLGGLLGASLLYHFLTEKKKRKPSGYLNSAGAGLLAGLLGYGLYDLSQGWGDNENNNSNRTQKRRVTTKVVTSPQTAAQVAASKARDKAVTLSQQVTGTGRPQATVSWSGDYSDAINQSLSNLYYENPDILYQAVNGPDVMSTFSSNPGTGYTDTYLKGDYYSSNPEQFISQIQAQGREQLIHSIAEELSKNNVQGDITAQATALADQMINYYSSHEQILTRARGLSSSITGLASNIANLHKGSVGNPFSEQQQALLSNYTNRQISLLERQLGRPLNDEEKTALVNSTTGLVKALIARNNIQQKINSLQDEDALYRQIFPDFDYVREHWYRVNPNPFASEHDLDWFSRTLRYPTDDPENDYARIPFASRLIPLTAYRFDPASKDGRDIQHFLSSEDDVANANELTYLSNSLVDRAKAQIQGLYIRAYYKQFPHAWEQLPGMTPEESDYTWARNPNTAEGIAQGNYPDYGKPLPGMTLEDSNSIWEINPEGAEDIIKGRYPSDATLPEGYTFDLTPQDAYDFLSREHPYEINPEIISPSDNTPDYSLDFNPNINAPELSLNRASAITPSLVDVPPQKPQLFLTTPPSDTDGEHRDVYTQPDGTILNGDVILSTPISGTAPPAYPSNMGSNSVPKVKSVPEAPDVDSKIQLLQEAKPVQSPSKDTHVMGRAAADAAGANPVQSNPTEETESTLDPATQQELQGLRTYADNLLREYNESQDNWFSKHLGTGGRHRRDIMYRLDLVTRRIEEIKTGKFDPQLHNNIAIDLYQQINSLTYKLNHGTYLDRKSLISQINSLVQQYNTELKSMRDHNYTIRLNSVVSGKTFNANDPLPIINE